LIIILIDIRKLLQNKLTLKLNNRQNHEIAEDGQKLRSNHVWAIITKKKHRATSWH